VHTIAADRQARISTICKNQLSKREKKKVFSFSFLVSFLFSFGYALDLDVLVAPAVRECIWL
jgi:hypothetical protein